MSVIAHHGGEALLLTAVLGSGLSASLLIVRARIAELVRRRWRRRP